MRTVDSQLAAQAVSNYRVPKAQAIVRQTQLKFTGAASSSNTLTGGIGDAYLGLNSRALCATDADVNPADGKILQCGAFGGTLQYRFAAAGINPVSVAWSNSVSSTAGCIPGVIYSGGSWYIYYYDNTGVLKRRVTTGSAPSSSAISGTFPTVADGVGIVTCAPSNLNTVFVSRYNAANYSVLLHAVNISAGTYSTAPRALFGSSQYPFASNENSVSFMDAFTFDDVTHYVVYGNSCAGKAWAVTYRDGIWGEPVMLIPQDYTTFVPYRASVVNLLDGAGKWVVLTGRVTRDNQTGFSPSLDVMLFSKDGLNWSELDRQSYLTTSEYRGKLLVAADKAVYFGIDHSVTANATYFLGYDASALKTTITQDVHSCSITYGGTNSAPTGQVSIANGDGTYTLTGNIQAGAEVWFSAGYAGTDGADHLAQLTRMSIEAPQKSVDGAQVTMDFSGNDALFKRLRTWTSPFYHDWRSQLKHRDECVDNGGLYSAGGSVWSPVTKNLGPINSGFEGSLGGTTPFPPADWTTTGDGAGVFVQWTNITGPGTNQSLKSVEIQKASSSPNARTFGLKMTTPLTAKKDGRYEAAIDVMVLALGSTGVVSLTASGNFSKDGKAKTTAATQNVTGGWNTLTINFTNENQSADTTTIDLSIDVYDVGAANVVIDNFSVVGKQNEWLTFSSRDNEGIMFSTEPLDTVDFDTRAEIVFDVSSPYDTQMLNDRVGFGLVGLAKDKDNLMALKVYRGTTGNVVLQSRRGGVYSANLASASVTVNGGAQHYCVRFVYRGGNFYGWVVAGTLENVTWGNPVISWTWAAGTGKAAAGTAIPCPTDSGAGKVGVWAKIDPYRFHIYAIDELSLGLPLRYNGDLDYSAFPTAGDVVVDDEVMTIDNATTGVARGHSRANWYLGAKSPTANIQTIVPLSHSNNMVSDEIPTPPWTDQYVAGTPEQTFLYDLGGGIKTTDLHRTFCSGAAGSTDTYKGYVLVITDGEGTGMNWYIHGSYPYSSGSETCRLLLGEDGHEVEFGSEFHDDFPANYIRPDSVLAITPVLRVSRGTTGKIITRHPDNSMVYLNTDDAIQLHTLEIYDGEPDYNTERLLKKICAAANVQDVQFGDTVNTAVITTGTPMYVYVSCVGNTGLNQYDFDLEFDTSTLPLVLNFRMDEASETQTPTNFSRLRITSSQIILEDIAGGTTTNVHTVNHGLTLPSLYHVRVIASGSMITVYINENRVLNCFTSLQAANTYNRMAFGSTFTVYNVRIPELHEWRDAVQVDNDADAMSSIDAIIGDRHIKYLSRSGDAIKFSAFDIRDELPETYQHTIESDVLAPDETQIFSFLRVYAEDVIEKVDDDLAKRHGLIFKAVQMPKADKTQAAAMMGRLFRSARENEERRSLTFAGADLRMECEDLFSITYTTPGELPAEITFTPTGADKQFIVDNVAFSYSPASFTMIAGTRRYSRS